jgi:hypothetical protein
MEKAKMDCELGPDFCLENLEREKWMIKCQWQQGHKNIIALG